MALTGKELSKQIRLYVIKYPHRYISVYKSQIMPNKIIKWGKHEKRETGK